MTENNSTSYIKLNQTMLGAMCLVAFWFWIRDGILGQPTGKTVAIEWACLIIFTVLLTFFRGLTLPVDATAAILIFLLFLSIFSGRSSSNFPDLWFGFGGQIAFLSSCATILVFANYVFGRAIKLINDAQNPKKISLFINSLSLAAVIWTLPTIIQPPSAWLNVGDATEKVLDEITGWVSGNIPGINTSWQNASMLGAPLIPLWSISGRGDLKILIIVVYVNLLVLLVPAVMAGIIHIAVKKISLLQAFAISLISVSVSGPRINTSLFQELSFLGRGLFPLLVCFSLVKICTTSEGMRHRSIFLLGVIISATVLNNAEYGVGAAMSALLVVLFYFRVRPKEAVKMFTLFLSICLTFAVMTIPGIFIGGSWAGRRVGAFEDVFRGVVTTQTFNNLGPIPPFGVFTIALGLAMAATAVGLPKIFIGSRNEPSTVVSTYIGMWVIFTAPYFLNGGGSGAFRSQFYLIPIVLLVCSNLTSQVETSHPDPMRPTARLIHLMHRGPLIFLIATLIACITQVPNGFKEWNRVVLAKSEERNIDTWSSELFDWIPPDEVVKLADTVGGVDVAGWWFLFGNAIEITTGVENLTGHTAFETMRTDSQLRHGCESLEKSAKTYVITHIGSVAQLERCKEFSFQIKGEETANGLIVVEIKREPKYLKDK